MEIQPASLAQVRKGRDGRRVLIEDDVLDIAKRLQEIDDSLKLLWNEYGEYFVVAEVVQTPDGPEERLVTTAQDLDERLLQRVEKITHPSYDFAKEVDRIDKEAEKEKDHRFHEETGEVGERLAHAVRKDLQHTGKAFVPKDVEK